MLKNREKIKNILLEHPQILEENNYEKLWEQTITEHPEMQNRKTSIERVYRDLKHNDQDIQKLIPIPIEIKTEKQEQIMHSIMDPNNWKGDDVVDFSNGQRSLLPYEEGF